jgi:methionyl-tRNA formyltransferase
MYSLGTVDQVVGFGGGPVMVTAVDLAIAKGFDVTVVSSPRQSNGTVSRNGDRTLQEHLASNEVSLTVVESVEDSQDVIGQNDDTTLGLSISAPWIFEQEFIDRFDGRLFNLHRTPLPRDRGRASKTWQILQDEKTGASTLHRIEPTLDTGPIVMAETYDYPEGATQPIDFLQIDDEHSAKLLDRFFDRVDAGESFELQSQSTELGTYWPALSTDVHGFVDWNWTAGEIRQFVRAFGAPYGGASTFYREEQVRIGDCRVTHRDGEFHPFQAGLIYRIDDERVFVAAREGGLVLRYITDDSGESMLPDIVVGERFYTPRSFLERAMRTRAFYPPDGLTLREYDPYHENR